MKFICDDMLGTLAKWLRILGHDTLYGAKDDDELLNISQKKKRVLLTRDKNLYERSKNTSPVIYIDSLSLNEQLILVLEKTGIKIIDDELLTRCLLCNTLLVKKTKHEVKKVVPPYPFQYHEKFWECPKCHRVYWKGSHWINMYGRIQKIIKKRKIVE
jgi:uncharacterized protein with PIN domain